MDKSANNGLKFIITFLIVFIFFFYFIKMFRDIMTFLALALILTYMFSPIMNYFEKRGFSKAFSIFIVYIILFLFLFSFIFLLIPASVDQLNTLIGELPHLTQNIKKVILDLLTPKMVNINPKMVEDVSKNVDNVLKDLQIGLMDYTKLIVMKITSIFSLIVFGSILVPFVLFYFLVDLDLFKKNFVSYIPPARRDEVFGIIEDVDKMLSKFIRGRVFTSIIVGILETLGLYLLGIKFALIVGVVSGILNFIPFIGPVIGTFIAILFSLERFSLIKILEIIILYIVVNQIESFVLNPRILGKELDLHPLTVILSFLFFGKMFGFLGILLAVPMMSLVKVLFNHYLKVE